MPEGCLYLVATPIGNLADLSPRAVEVLKLSDIVACEDTRVTRKLLNHVGIRRTTLSYREENEKKIGAGVGRARGQWHKSGLGF